MSGNLVPVLAVLRDVRVMEVKRNEPAAGQAQGPHIYPTLPPVPTGIPRFACQRSSGVTYDWEGLLSHERCYCAYQAKRIAKVCPGQTRIYNH